jgi:hypothetical protein
VWGGDDFGVGGVAANSQLRTTFEQRARAEGLAVYFPDRELSTDNAAMIAAAAYAGFREEVCGCFVEREGQYAWHDADINAVKELDLNWGGCKYGRFWWNGLGRKSESPALALK